jgi:MerR family redox-sensitive transcriptional activator SoxR
METISIGDAARKTGLSQSAIRFYEAEGLLASPERTGGWRAFGPEDVDQLQVIRIARDLGFSLADIRVLLTGFSPDTPPPERWQELAREKLPQVDAVIQQALAMKSLLEKGLRCDCVSVADCIRYDCNPPVSIARRRA